MTTDTPTPALPSNVEELPTTLEGQWETPEGFQMAKDYLSRHRGRLCWGDLTDMEAAHRIAMLSRNDPEFEPTLSMAKDRIRYLSVQLALATARASTPTDKEAGELREMRENARRASTYYGVVRDYIIALERECELSHAPSPPKQAPVDMILFCPRCGRQHVDEPDERTPDWTNPPHRSHLCHFCDFIWRPADAETNGVREIKTVGKKDMPYVGSVSFAPQQQDGSGLVEALKSAPRPERFVHADDIAAIEYADWFHKVRGKALASTPKASGVMREQAEANVIAARGSWDVPGFEACVEAEMERLSDARREKP